MHYWVHFNELDNYHKGGTVNIYEVQELIRILQDSANAGLLASFQSATGISDKANASEVVSSVNSLTGAVTLGSSGQTIDVTIEGGTVNLEVAA